MAISFDGCVSAEVICGADPFRFMGRKRIKARPTWRVVIEGDPLAQLARLWAALPPFAYDTMCHDPGFGFRIFDAGGEALACAALCFNCNNISLFVASDEREHWITFDAESPQGQEMLAFLRGLGPDPDPPPSGGRHF